MLEAYPSTTFNSEDIDKLFESIYRALPDAVIFLDTSRIIRMVNPAFVSLFHYSSNEALGQSSVMLFANLLDFHEQGKKLAMLVGSEMLPMQEMNFCRRGGSEVICETLATPVRDNSGRLLGFVRIVRNISERKAAEAQTIALAHERSRMAVLSKFLTDASHDFRHPLSRMTTNLYMLERKVVQANVASVEGNFHAIKEQIKKVDTLLDDLLLMIRLDTGLGLDLHPAYLNPLLEAIFQEWRPTAFQKGVELGINLSDSPTLKLDAALFRTAIGHLLENAIRHTAAGGKVTLSSLSDGQHVFIHVQDSGIGINEFDQKHIFERFYTVDASRNDETSGSGLGLAIAKSIVEQCGGTLGVASELGEGSIFHIVMPVWAS